MDSSYPPRKSLRGPGGLLVVLDAREIFPDDPGNGTPILVKGPFGRGCSTFWAAQGEAELLDDKEGAIQLTQEQQEWLNSLDVALTEWLELYTKAIKRDGREAVLAAAAGRIHP